MSPAEKPSSKRLVVPKGAIKRFEKIFEEGGKITGITINYTLPASPGRQAFGAAFLFTRNEINWRIEE
jgi:hypothetical protein